MGCCGGKTAPVGEGGVTIHCPDGDKYATPDAEVMARARGINLCLVTATGRMGKIINRQDVLRFLAAGG